MQKVHNSEPATVEPGESKGTKIHPECTYHYGSISLVMNDVLGKLLTMVEAMTTDVTQRKAWKSIIKNEFYQAAWDLRTHEGNKLIAPVTNFSEILWTGSRGIDEDTDLNDEGKFKN
jgi:hypothetical protein